MTTLLAGGSKAIAHAAKWVRRPQDPGKVLSQKSYGPLPPTRSSTSRAEHRHDRAH